MGDCKACKGTGVLDARVIDGTPGRVACSFCLPGHAGRFVWLNGAEQRWECDDDCPHPIHEEQP